MPSAAVCAGAAGGDCAACGAPEFAKGRVKQLLERKRQIVVRCDALIVPSRGAACCAPTAADFRIASNWCDATANGGRSRVLGLEGVEPRFWARLAFLDFAPAIKRRARFPEFSRPFNRRKNSLAFVGVEAAWRYVGTGEGFDGVAAQKVYASSDRRDRRTAENVAPGDFARRKPRPRRRRAHSSKLESGLRETALHFR